MPAISDILTEVTLDGRVVALRIRRHRKARRILLRISPGHDSIILTLPMRTALPKGMAFVYEKKDWILAHTIQPAKQSLTHDAVFDLLGQPTRIERKEGRGTTMLSAGPNEAILTVYGGATFTARRVRDFLKAHLYAYLLERVTAHAGKLGKQISKLQVRDLQSRWGSCTATRILTFNWRLVFAPPDVVDYLVAHEVAHLVEMNHSKKFWNVVETLHPHSEAPRHWLKQHGHILHGFA